MIRSRRWTSLSILASMAVLAIATRAVSRDLEILPTPATAAGVIHVDGPHVVHGGCCESVCGHCSPRAHHKYRLSARRALKCQGSVELCMHVVNPNCCGCPVEIPMCVPACCVEPPVVHCDRGLFGRGVVCLDWPCCGYSARVIFMHNGMIDVIYTGR
jgi:hypothetical protein